MLTEMGCDFGPHLKIIGFKTKISLLNGNDFGYFHAKLNHSKHGLLKITTKLFIVQTELFVIIALVAYYCCPISRGGQHKLSSVPLDREGAKNIIHYYLLLLIEWLGYAGLCPFDRR